MRVIEVWTGVYVGNDEYEGGTWDYQTKDEKVHNIQYDVVDTNYDTLYNGLVKEVKKLLKNSDVVDKDSLDLTFLDCAEKLVFSLDDGTELEFEFE